MDLQTAVGKGNETSCRFSTGHSLIHLAASKDYEPVLELLLDNGADTTAVHPSDLRTASTTRQGLSTALYSDCYWIKELSWM